MFPKVKILNIEIDNVSLSELLPSLKEGVIVTPNVDHLMKLQNDFEFYKLYREADYVICDSQILFFASKILNTPIKEKLCGSDFFPALCEYNKFNKDFKVFLLGGSEKSVVLATKNLNKKYGRNVVVDFYSPPFGFENDKNECKKIINKINESGATVLAVGVGAPKQEKWIYENKKFLSQVKIYLAVGATIEFEAGTLSRAPKWMSDSGFEWLFRLLTEPKRLWRRYLVDSMPFFRLLFYQKINMYSDPFTKSYKTLEKRKTIERNADMHLEKTILSQPS